MLHIPPQSGKILKAKNAFYTSMIDLVYERIDNIKTINNIDNIKAIRLFDTIINNYLDDLLIGSPSDLVKINARINPSIQNVPDFKKAVEYVFNYDWFCVKKSKLYCAYDLAAALEINTCVYCNRNYTSTVIRKDKKKITRPQFDHFFDKGRNPLLAISFFNLVPSCAICNSGIKGDAEMNLDDYLHPYIDDILADITFTYKYETPPKVRIKVKTPRPSKAFNTTELFAIEEIYNAHTSELQDMLRIRNFFSHRYLDILSSSLLKDVIVSKSDLYRVVFGTEYLATDFIKRPFSKFKSDILKELGVI